MDCISFNKDIDGYLSGTLDDEELNEFLLHLDSCSACAEELEINFIVREGVRILDRKNSSYDLTTAFKKNLKANADYISLRKYLLRLSYVSDTIAFWALLSTVFIFFRIIIKA